MAVTGRDIATFALKKSGITGIGRNPSAIMLTDALADFNDMLTQWQTNRWLVWNLLDLGVTSTGLNGYTVGPGQQFNCSVAPTRLEYAYQRQIVNTGLPVDTPLRVIDAREQYDAISLKGLVSFGLYVFLDTAWPTSLLKLYPIPNAGIYEIHIVLKNVLPVVVANTDMSVVPPHYIAAFKFNLARILRQAYGKGRTPDEELNRMAMKSLETITQANIQVPELVMPKTLIIQSSGYNILNDQFGNG